MRRQTTSVCVHPIRTLTRETGLWCDRRALPSGAAFDHTCSLVRTARVDDRLRDAWVAWIREHTQPQEVSA